MALLVARGDIAFTAPETLPAADAPSEVAGSQDETAAPEDAALSSETDAVSGREESAASASEDEELAGLSDPFFDMALSAVIPLAGDPVLLTKGAAGTGVDLIERPLPTVSDLNAVMPNTAQAYLLDSQMLDETGNLVIRAPGSEADFQFGNFGGGDDSGALDVTNESPDQLGSTKSALPTFLRPSINTLNLYLNEKPIGQGASRIEVTEKIAENTTLKSFLSGQGFDDKELKSLMDYAASEFGRSDLIAGDKIAVRGVRLPNQLGRLGDYYQVTQLSLYASDGYVGTAALSKTPQGASYVAGADPWFGKEIAPGVETSAADEGEGGKTHRLIDGLYATAVRNAVPASIVGEAIAYLAPMTDLKRAIRPNERFSLIFTGEPRDTKRGGGKVLFAGIRSGNAWSVRCYVLKAPGNRGFACVNEGGQVSLSGAMLVPVKGVLTSKFGPRFHPIKKIERLHAGVDWAAPTGTPIRAAFSGKVTYRDVRGGYGNFIELTHKGGITSRYAHLHDYGDGIQLGSVVQAGDVIGYVGTTGLSTGPHLHFEIRQNGQPKDPLAFEMETGADAPQSVARADLKAYRNLISEILTLQ